MTQWLFQTLLSLTLLMLLVLALRAPVGRLFGARWAYALWLAPAIRLVMPPLSLPGADLPSKLVPEMLGAAAYASPSSKPELATTTIWLLLWIVGAVAFFLWQLLSHQKLVMEIGSTSQAAEPPSYGGVPVIESRGARGALAVGLWSPRIVVPADFSNRYSERERRLVLEHELVHHRRGDIWWNWFALLLLAANWFNPVAYLAFRAFRADQELSCDAAVAARLSAAERYDYASALVKSATGARLVAVCPLNHAAQLKQRLKMLKHHQDTAKLRLAGALAVAAVVAGGVALTPSSGMAARTGGEEAAASGGALRSLLHPVGGAGAPPEACPQGSGEVGAEIDFGNGQLRRSVNCILADARPRADEDALAAEPEKMGAEADRRRLSERGKTVVLVDLVRR